MFPVISASQRFASFAQSKPLDLSMDVDYDVHTHQQGAHAKSLIDSSDMDSLRTASYSPLRRMWEGFRDLCYIVQDSKFFQNLTTGLIIANAIVLAMVW